MSGELTLCRDIRTCLDRIERSGLVERECMKCKHIYLASVDAGPTVKSGIWLSIWCQACKDEEDAILSRRGAAGEKK